MRIVPAIAIAMVPLVVLLLSVPASRSAMLSVLGGGAVAATALVGDQDGRRTGAVQVATTAELLAALRAAGPGETIQLAAGLYRDVKIQGVRFDQTVTVRGADAKLGDLLVRNAKGLRFENLEFEIQPGGEINQFQVLNSEDVHFSDIDLHGVGDVALLSKQGGLLLRNSTRLSVTGSGFHRLVFGLSMLDCTAVEIEGNVFRNLRTDGIRGGGVSDLRVTDNYFSDFFPALGDHPDAIQLWTTNTDAAARDITITRNVVVRGSGAVVQGIFLRDQLDRLPYQNVTISDNLILGTMWNGITVDGGSNIEIARNKVIGFPDMKSWIRLENISGGLLVDNVAQQYNRLGTLTNFKERGNSTAPAIKDGGEAALRAWKAAGRVP